MKQNKASQSVIMFLDQSFGSLRLEGTKTSARLAGIDLAPGIAGALAQIKEAEARTILVVPEPLPRRALAILEQHLPQVDNFILQEQDLPTSIAACAQQFSMDPRQTIFVSTDRVARGKAMKLVERAMPHPILAALTLRGRSLHFVRITGNREHVERIPEIVPYYAENTERGAWSLLAAISSEAMAELIRRRLHVDVLALDLASEDPVFVQLDEMNEKVITELKKQKVLYADDQRMLVALQPEQFTDSLQIHGRHGHFQALFPSLELLHAVPDSSNSFQSERLILGRWPIDQIKAVRIYPPVLDLIPNPCPSTAASFQADVDRYRGASSLDASGPIISRHIRHPDNQRAVQALLSDLKAMGYCAYTHSFEHAGRTLKNVIADLPGTGLFRLSSDILERLRKVIFKYPLPDPPDPWMREIRRLTGSAWLKEQEFDHLSPLEFRMALEKLFLLKPWFPWWLRHCRLPGVGAKLVIVGCHLDSTAGSTSGFDPLVDPAPGADDDASGIAATLALARHFASFRGRFPHTIRFCFFNAEESGLVGSKTYAAMLKAAGAPLKAVVCMDMISYNSDPQRIFEIHAGYTDPAIRDLNLPIANRIAAWAAHLGALAPAQIYSGTSSAPGADRSLHDGAINRSDHASFHEQGYPAVVVSEDFFANLATEPGADPNPNYHRETDTVFDSSYGSDITCAVALAVRELAGG